MVTEHGYTSRGKFLLEVLGLIENDRNRTYGPPTEHFKKTVGQLNALGYRGPGGRELLPHDVAIIFTADKLSRRAHMPEHRDSWLDTAGYSACGWECVEEELERKELPVTKVPEGKQPPFLECADCGIHVYTLYFGKCAECKEES